MVVDGEAWALLFALQCHIEAHHVRLLVFLATFRDLLQVAGCWFVSILNVNVNLYIPSTISSLSTFTADFYQLGLLHLPSARLKCAHDRHHKAELVTDPECPLPPLRLRRTLPSEVLHTARGVKVSATYPCTAT